MNTILVLKPIIDALYNEMKEYKERSDKRIKELETELSMLKQQKKQQSSIPIVIESDSDDDDAFIETAMAPPASSPTSVLTQVEIKNENSQNNTTHQDEIKSVKMIGGKDAKEYMKEYQRSYRKKQKENTINKTK